MADSSTTTARIPYPFAGGCWAHLWLRNGIRFVPIAWKLRKSWSAVELIPWRISLNGRLLHNCYTDSNSLHCSLSGSTPATRRYEVRPYAVNTHGVTGWRSPELNGRLLHNRWPNSNSVLWRLLGSTPATRRYKVRLCRTKTHAIAVLWGGGQSSPGGILLDGWFLHNRWVYSNSVPWRLLGSSPATQQYKVRPYAIKTQEVDDLYKGSTLVEYYLMADSSTTVEGIPILFYGGCWAQRQLHAGIRLIPTPLIFMKLPYPGELLWGGARRPECPAPREVMSVTPVFRYSTRITKFNRILFKRTLNMLT